MDLEQYTHRIKLILSHKYQLADTDVVEAYSELVERYYSAGEPVARCSEALAKEIFD